MTERLEEILNDLPYSIRHSGEIEELKEFAREQAERVEGLLEQTGHNFEVNRKLDAENQRYKQAIENALKRIEEGGAGTRTIVKGYLEEALEREG